MSYLSTFHQLDTALLQLHPVLAASAASASSSPQLRLPCTGTALALEHLEHCKRMKANASNIINESSSKSIKSYTEAKETQNTADDILRAPALSRLPVLPVHNYQGESCHSPFDILLWPARWLSQSDIIPCGSWFCAKCLGTMQTSAGCPQFLQYVAKQNSNEFIKIFIFEYKFLIQNNSNMFKL